MNKTTKNLLVSLLTVVSSAVASAESGHEGHDMAKHRHVGNEPRPCENWKFCAVRLQSAYTGNLDAVSQ